MPKYNHVEAYCLMKYRSDDGTEEEIIWNSRDGVTPFVITLRSGKTARHVDWRQDRCEPNYVPPIGSRIFVDLTRERALEMAQRTLDRWSNDPETVKYFEQGYAITTGELAESYLTPGAPDLIEVGPVIYAFFLTDKNARAAVVGRKNR